MKVNKGILDFPTVKQGVGRPLLVFNGVIAPINGRKQMGSFGYNLYKWSFGPTILVETPPKISTLSQLHSNPHSHTVEPARSSAEHLRPFSEPRISEKFALYP